MRYGRSARLVAVACLAAAALIGGAGAAQADPPPGWEPGPDGIEYDLGSISWSHHGWYEGHRGNWHVGLLDVEEDDDGITGVLRDWRCPAGVQPPTQLYEPGPTRCKDKGYLWFENTQFSDLSTFDQDSNRLTVNATADVLDPNKGWEVIGQLPIDITIAGRGVSQTTYQDYGDFMYFDEIWTKVNAWGKVDGHRVKGPNTTLNGGRVGYWLDGWVRTN